MLEPGTRVNHAAVLLASRVGCLLIWVGEALELLIGKKPLEEFTRQEDVTVFSDGHALLPDTLISTPFPLKYLTLVEEK